MNSIFTALSYKALTLFLSFVALFMTVEAPATDDAIVFEDDVLMSAVLWGDTQIADYKPGRYFCLKNAVTDLANSESNIDALVIAGDIAENGKNAEYKLVLDCLALADNVDNHILTVGNHDVRLRRYSKVVERFCEIGLAANEKLDMAALSYKEGKLTYSYEVNGYTFVVLGTDKTKFEESYFTSECLEWLDAELEKATEDGKPVFVILHQPLKETHQVWQAWNSPDDKAGTVGEQSDELLEIMNRYDNLFLITGHLHMGFSHEWSVHEIGNFWGINLPGIGPNNADGDYYNESGTGYIMEVREDSVTFRARDFNLGKYISDYDVKIDLK